MVIQEPQREPASPQAAWAAPLWAQEAWMNPTGQLTWNGSSVRAPLASGEPGDLPFSTICHGAEMPGQWEEAPGMASD